MIETLVAIVMLPLLVVYIAVNIVAEIVRMAMACMLEVGAWIDRRLGTDHLFYRFRHIPGSWVNRLARLMGRQHE